MAVSLSTKGLACLRPLVNIDPKRLELTLLIGRLLMLKQMACL